MKGSKTNVFVRLRVLFLDFDGVLNSGASVAASVRRRLADPTEKTPVNEDLCPVLCSNFQEVLDALPDVRVVISSSWRLLFDLEALKAKLRSYGVDGDRVIDVTPLTHDDQSDRGDDITAWIKENPEVRDYAILDDVDNMTVHRDRLVLTDYAVGLTRKKVDEAISILKGRAQGMRCFQQRFHGGRRHAA